MGGPDSGFMFEHVIFISAYIGAGRGWVELGGIIRFEKWEGYWLALVSMDGRGGGFGRAGGQDLPPHSDGLKEDNDSLPSQ